VLAATLRLGVNPRLGNVRSPVSLRYRFWPLARYAYLLVDDPNTDPAQIVREVHTKRDLPRVLADRPVQLVLGRSQSDVSCRRPG
jgi:hypothetical protein